MYSTVRYCCQFLIKLEFSGLIFEKNSVYWSSCTVLLVIVVRF
jgi:hypothetical protein